MLKVNKTMCNQCLFSKNKIVSEARKKEIIKTCKKEQHYFICHKSNDVVCGGFNKVMGEQAQMIRIARRLKVIEFIDVEKT